MTFFLPQNPGIGGLDELTDAEALTIQNLASLGDPNADRILFWDYSAGDYAYLTIGSGLSITDTTLSASAGTIDGSGTTNELVYWVDSNTLGSLAVATYPSLTELSYVKGVTSAIQTQLNAKGAGTVTSVTSANGAATIATTTTTPVITIVSAPILTTARAIYGNNFDGSAALTQVIASTYGGTGNGFTKFTGPTSTEKTFTLPDANATLARTDAGQTFTGTQLLAENASIGLDPAGSADGKFTGITVTATAGYTQAFGDLVYLDPTDSRWEACDANAAAGADGDSRGLIGMVVVAGTDGNACTILLNGIIRADAKFPAFTVNNPIYVSETASEVTQTQPTTTDVVIRIVGFALTADEMYFNPDNTYITHI